jgi:hypothetical protein
MKANWPRISTGRIDFIRVVRANPWLILLYYEVRLIPASEFRQQAQDLEVQPHQCDH